MCDNCKHIRYIITPCDLQKLIRMHVDRTLAEMFIEDEQGDGPDGVRIDPIHNRIADIWKW